MKKYLFSILVLCISTLLPAQKALTLEDCFTFYRFYPESGPDFQYMADGQHYVMAEKGSIVRYNLLTGVADSVLIPQKEFEIAVDNFILSADEQLILLQSGTEAVYRHSVLADYAVFDLRTRKYTKVNEKGSPVQYAALSPDGSHVVYVQNNNLYIKDLTNDAITQVTTDGEKNKIINGIPDWVYEEEFSPVSGEGMVATQWSPDGKRVAFLRFDESLVPTMPMTWYEGGAYPRHSEFKYPKVGQANSVVSVHVFDLNTGQIADCGDVKQSPDDYVVRLNWASKYNLVATRLNRNQDTLELVLLTPDAIEKGLVKAYTPERMLLETDAAYVDVHDNLRFLSNGQQFVWASERSGFNHLYLYDYVSGNLIRPLTTGNFEVTAFYGVDEKNGTFYFQAATPTPLDRQIWEGNLSGGAPRLLTPSRGTYDAQFSPSFELYTLTWSDANTPTIATLCNRKGETLRTFTNNEKVKKARQEYDLAEKKFWTFPLADGTVLNGWMIQPTVLDSARKYPVLFDIYGGPGSQTVLNQYDGYMGAWHQMLVKKGYIIVSVDNRGTGGRGRDFKKMTQLELGKYETEDQIAAANYLRTMPWVDSARIGIWGWSFGGYLSTSCVLKGNNVFKMAMAVAPVTNWKWYDSAYTERYMHTTSDNAAGYERNSPINFAAQLRGSNYLICHGTADDNVHWQQTTEMINALIKAGKQFDTYYYPNRNHGIYGDNATRHLFTKLTAFIEEKL